MAIVIKYTYQMSAGGWDFPAYKDFETFGKALRWAMETKAAKRIKGFRVVEFRKDVKLEINLPTGCTNKNARSAYRYEGSTDAELLGMRY